MLYLTQEMRITDGWCEEQALISKLYFLTFSCFRLACRVVSHARIVLENAPEASLLPSGGRTAQIWPYGLSCRNGRYCADRMNASWCLSNVHGCGPRAQRCTGHCRRVTSRFSPFERCDSRYVSEGPRCNQRYLQV